MIYQNHKTILFFFSFSDKSNNFNDLYNTELFSFHSFILNKPTGFNNTLA